MPGVTGPVFGMLENVQEVTLRHARTELLLEGRQSGWLGGCCDLPEMRRSVVGYTEFGVVGQAGVDGGGHGGKIGLQHGREILTSFGDAEGRAVGGKPALTLGPRQELGSVVREVLGADDVEIAVLQSICQVDEDANFQRTPVDGDLRPAPDHETSPALRREAEIKVTLYAGPACVTVRAHDSPGVQQAAVLCRRPDIEQVDKPEQQGAMPRMDGPEQRQIVVPVPGRHGLASRRQGIDAAVLRQQRSDARTKGNVGIMRLRRLEDLAEEDLAEDANQGFLGAPVLVVQRLELLLRDRLR